MGVRRVKYFRATQAAYEAARAAIDAACGFPSAGTESCLPPAEELPRDAGGRIVVVVYDWMPAVATARAAMRSAVASGDVVEITEAEYVAVSVQSSPGGGLP